jgi:hypothetical protein
VACDNARAPTQDLLEAAKFTDESGIKWVGEKSSLNLVNQSMIAAHLIVVSQSYTVINTHNELYKLVQSQAARKTRLPVIKNVLF